MCSTCSLRVHGAEALLSERVSYWSERPTRGRSHGEEGGVSCRGSGGTNGKGDVLRLEGWGHPVVTTTIGFCVGGVGGVEESIIAVYMYILKKLQQASSYVKIERNRRPHILTGSHSRITLL